MQKTLEFFSISVFKQQFSCSSFYCKKKKEKKEKERIDSDISREYFSKI